MSANLPSGFYANVIREAFPVSHTYKVALFSEVPEFANYEPSGECVGHGYAAGGMPLNGYKVVDHGTHAMLAFDTVVDWFDVTVKTRAAVVYDADTGVVLNIMNFGKDCGVIGGLFTVTLHADGVVQLGVEE